MATLQERLSHSNLEPLHFLADTIGPVLRAVTAHRREAVNVSVARTQQWLLVATVRFFVTICGL